MGLYEDMLARISPGAFPPIAAPPIDPIEEATAAQAAREAAALRLARGVRRDTPLPEGSLLPFGTLGAGMLPPGASVADQPVVPSFEGGIVPQPRDRPKEADGSPVGDGGPPTDLSGASVANPDRMPQPGAVSPPAVAAPPAPAAPVASADQPTTFGSLASGLMSGLKNNSSTLLALGAGFAGAPNIGQGISRAAAAAIPAQQFDIKNRMTLESQKQTLQALLAKKVPMADALAAISNPDVMKATVAKYFEAKPMQHVMIKDSLGNETPASFDQNTGKYKDASGTEIKPGDATTGGVSAAAKLPPTYDPVTKRDDAFLAALDPVTASAVKDIADGKLAGTGRNLQKLMPLVARYENGFDNTTYQARQALQKSYYGGGEGAKALRTANTTIDHGLQLQKAIDDLHNYSVLPGFLNPVTGAVSKQFDKKYQDALARFKTNSELYSKELDVALTGKSTVSGAQHIRDMFDANASPVTNKAALQQTLEMLDQRINEHENTYKTGMNQKGAAFTDMLTQRDKLKKLLGQDTGAGVSSHGPTAAPSGKTSTGVPWSIVQ